MAQLNFDARNVAPAEAPEAIPAGWYNARVTNSEMKPTSDGTGAYLQLEMTILDGDFATRKLFDRINLQNKNPVATEIGYRQLSAVCHATGVIQVQDSQQLHGIPMKVKVSLRPAGPGADGKHYDASNEIKGYKNINDGVGGAQSAAPAMPPQPQGFGAPAQPYGQAPAQQAMPPQGYAPQPQGYAPQPQPQQWAPPAQQAPQQQWQPPVQQAAAPVMGQPGPGMQTATPAQNAQAAPQAPAGNTPPWMQPQQQQPQQPAPQQAAPAAGPVPPWAQPQ